MAKKPSMGRQKIKIAKIEVKNYLQVTFSKQLSTPYGRSPKKIVGTTWSKGNMHKVPDEPRPRAPPTPIIPLKDFKKLLRRRSTALASLRSSQSHFSVPDPASVLTPNSSRPEPKETKAKIS
ncbi:hypothetical protein F511_22680 [Dorcoceras hygrometricum]|uniref:MADS-box domain-containing protein n=1 Tax=Dorcoceras hygrometricum TaxID=472368 RepID=A0A2Z7C5Y0_9LAMI|nr:hypothetical protein F511_22680 [Dorcoceras hygrometricum]